MLKKVQILSLALFLILLLYLLFTLLFVKVFQEVAAPPALPASTPTLRPTFTPNAPTPTPTLPPPTLTPVPTLPPTTTSTSTPVSPHVVSAVAVNVRSGPGTNYPVVGSLPANTPRGVVGRNQSGDWWKMETGWVADAVVEARNVSGVPVVEAPPPPATPTSTPPPETPTPTRPAYQFSPTGWYDDTNPGLTRFLGNITDSEGEPVNGVRVEAMCGTYKVLSDPSGGRFRNTWPDGFYDITLARYPIPCVWRLTVVAAEDGETVSAYLSETVEIETTVEKSIIVANWRKNW